MTLIGEATWSDLGQVSSVEQNQYSHGRRPSSKFHHESSERFEGESLHSVVSSLLQSISCK